MYKNIIILSAIAFFGCNTASEKSVNGRLVSYQESPFQQQIDSLLDKMTLQEKIGQLNLPSAGDISTGLANNTGIANQIKEGRVGGLFNIAGLEKIRKAQEVAVNESRLGIPLLFAMDVIHGFKSTFPIPLGFSCSWDMDLIEELAQVSAKEATANGIAWTFSPMTDIARDPRWGRVSEGLGEDPYLGAQIAAAMVKGYQGDDLSATHTMMACVKHFALYGAIEAGRDYNTVDMSRLRMYNDYFPPYKGAIDAGVGSVMASFNEVDGIPASGNKWLMTEVLRNQWGFRGMVVTDYTGINEMIEHGVGDLQQVSAMALDAGIDMDMVGGGFLLTLEKSLQEGTVTEDQIDLAVSRILEAKFKLGLFDDPYRYIDEKRSATEVFTTANRKFARKVAGESFVLLKNDKNVLPLKKKQTIALIGPLVDNRENMPGTWSVSTDVDKAITVVEGIKQVAGDDVTILSARGANYVADADLEKRVSVFGKDTHRDSRSAAEMQAEALAIAAKADVIVAALGEPSEMSGESSSRTNLDLPSSQKELLKALVATGKPVVLVLFTGRPLTLAWEQEHVSAILNVWFPGTEAGLAIADVLFGVVNPSGKLTSTFPQNLGQVPLYYNHKNTGRPLESEWFQKFKSNYLDVTNEPLYPFGYGLSYSDFQYGKMKLSKMDLKRNEKLTVSVPITNAGEIDGKEVVQLYIRDMVGSTTRPVQELKAFQKVLIKAGETKTVSFEISAEDLKYYTYKDQLSQEIVYLWEAGAFEIMVGTNASEVQKQMVNWNK